MASLSLSLDDFINVSKYSFAIAEQIYHPLRELILFNSPVFLLLFKNAYFQLIYFYCICI